MMPMTAARPITNTGMARQRCDGMIFKFLGIESSVNLTSLERYPVENAPSKTTAL